jgi:hypothetical protein
MSRRGKVFNTLDIALKTHAGQMVLMILKDDVMVLANLSFINDSIRLFKLK